MIKSQALEANLASYRVDVTIDDQYTPFQQAMSRYYGLMKGVTTFLKELSHPYKNWEFIVGEARGYALDYFHLLRRHEHGPPAAQILMDVFLNAIQVDLPPAVKADAVDNLLLYLQKISKEAGDKMDDFIHVLHAGFDGIAAYGDDLFFLFVKSYYPLKRLAGPFQTEGFDPTGDYRSLNRLLIRYFKAAYTFWIDEKDPLDWFFEEAGDVGGRQQFLEIFGQIGHAHLKTQRQRLTQIESGDRLGSLTVLRELLTLTGHNDLVEAYRAIPQRLWKSAPKQSQGNRWKIIFLFYIMNISGLSLIHEEVLRDINRTVSWLIDNESHSYILKLIETTFSILKKRARHFPGTALNCVLNMGNGVYKTDEIELINAFIDSVIDLGFQAPMLGGVGNDWQLRMNKAHLQNVRTWLALIELAPKFSVRLISNLVIHISICGVFIKDTDLFPRDITRLLNSDIAPVYNQIKQLARLFPVFFNDIGAEGQLRDISTRIDELTHRRDLLIHFLRKQSHVESSNRILGFMEAVIHYWSTGDKRPLTPYIPPNIYEQIQKEGPYIDGVKQIMAHLRKKGVALPDGLLSHAKDHIALLMNDLQEIPALDVERVELLIGFYKLLNQKYNLEFIEIHHYIEQLNSEAWPDLAKLKRALAEPELKSRIFMLLDYLDLLKSLILSPHAYDIKEDIYKKRHFTVDIPSMYGSYHEAKFDALGLTFRLEALINVLLEELVDGIDLSFITRATFNEIYDRLMLFDKALRLDGIYSVELERQLDLLAHALEVRGFTFTQYLDIFKGFAQAVKNIINDYFNNIHGSNLTRMLSKTTSDLILDKYHPKEDTDDVEKLKHRTSEIFFRDRIAASLGLQQLDIFLSRILNTLFHQSNKLPKEMLHLLLNYDPKRAITSLVNPNSQATGIIHLGNKGLNMLKLKNFGLPVPPGFIITTEVFRCRGIIDGFPPAEQNFNEQVDQHILEIEKVTGKRFGDPGNPLLFSVRSGSSISQPGMMDTFLDVGINDEIGAGLAAKANNPWFAWDSYRRFIQCWGMAHGLERDDFDAIISDFKKRLGIPLKRSFSGQQMRQVAMAYKERVFDEGYPIPENPLEQVHATIKLVFSSWDSAKARTYRKIMGISDDWGTAVTLQEMVYGNLSQSSGSGVIFTHNPRWAGDTLSLWGDFTLENQGEDVVAGLVKTLPISVKQQESEMRDTDIILETHFPNIYQEIKRWANLLIYKKGWGPQEMEFTFEGLQVQELFLLQTRDMAIREKKQVIAFDLEERKKAPILGNGIGVSGGAMSGRVVFSLKDVDQWRTREPETHLILIRNDTVPDDIREIFAADGLLTARGGVSSHAAVVAHRLGRTCVVACGNLVCDEFTKTAQFGDMQVRSGGFISIDGREGTVYGGPIKISKA